MNFNISLNSDAIFSKFPKGIVVWVYAMTRSEENNLVREIRSGQKLHPQLILIVEAGKDNVFTLRLDRVADPEILMS